MRKLKLEMEDLAVESFTPAPARPARGTAHAHADTVKRDADTVNRDADTVQLENGGGATVSVCAPVCSQFITDCYLYC